MYAERLVSEKVVGEVDVKRIVENHLRHLSDELEASKVFQPEAYYYKKQWSGIEQASASITTWDTGMDYDILHHIGVRSVSYPSTFVSLFSALLRCRKRLKVSSILSLTNIQINVSIAGDSSTPFENACEWPTGEIGKRHQD